MEKKETNYEHFKDQIIPIIAKGFSMGFDHHLNTVEACHLCNCTFCKFNSNSCSEKREKWLVAEYQYPKPKLTKQERAFIDSIVEDFNIDRDSEGLFLEYDYFDTVYLELDSNRFRFIDESKVWSKKDLLSLEVE